MTRTRFRGERGLVGKLAILWLVLLAMFVVVAFDAGSIALTRYKVASAAQDAAQEAATAFKQSGNRNDAFQAAVQQVAQEDPGARIPKNGFSIDQSNGQVTVTVVKTASTLIAGRVSLFQDLTKAKATSTSGPSVF